MVSYLTDDDKKKIGFYILQNTITGETYAGSGNLLECWYRHHAGYVNGKHVNENVREAFKRTPEGWEFLPVAINEPDLNDSETRKVAFAIEQSILDDHFDNPLFLNIAKSVTSPTKGVRQSAETIAKRVSKTIGQKRSDSFKEGQRQNVLARGGIRKAGFIQTIETKQKQSVSRTLWHSELTEDDRIKHMAPATKAATIINIGNKHRLGIKDSDETRERKRIALLGNKYSLGFKHPPEFGERLANKVIIDGIEYRSQKDAAALLGISRTEIGRRLDNPKLITWNRVLEK